jgi:predicted phosphodiesterase
MMQNNMKRYVWCGDIHGERPYWEMMLPFIKDFKPDVFGIAGDLFDFSVISEFEHHRRGFMGTKAMSGVVEEEVAEGNNKLDEIDTILPNAKKVFIKGNHDKRYDEYAHYQACQFKPQDRLIENRLNLAERGWTFVDELRAFKLGKCYFMHGEKMGTDNFAKQAAVKLRKNVRLWHHHTNQSYMSTSPLDSNDCCEVKAVGCLCDKDPFYMRGTTNRWVHSFLVGYVFPNGNFQDFIVNIIDGKFVAPNGKLYK